MLLAENLLLLLTDDTTGKLVVNAQQADLALGGAVLVELALQSRVGLAPSGRIEVGPAEPIGDAVLDGGARILATQQGKKPQAAVRALTKNLRPALYARLVEAGMLRSEEGKVLGIFPTHRWPAQDAEEEARTRREITAALVEGVPPRPDTAALISLLHALKAVKHGVDAGANGVRPRELEARAETVSAGDWGSAAVRKAVQEMAAAAATMVAVTAGAAAGAGS